MGNTLCHKELRKGKTLYIRVDRNMLSKLQDIKEKTGISVSEIIREAVRRLLQEIESTGGINLKIQ